MEVPHTCFFAANVVFATNIVAVSSNLQQKNVLGTSADSSGNASPVYDSSGVYKYS